MDRKPLKILLILGTILMVILLVASPLLHSVFGPAVRAIQAASAATGGSSSLAQFRAFLPFIAKSYPTVLNFEALHRQALTVPVEQCIACHGDRAEERSLSPDYPTPHRIHLTDALLKFQCTSCHRSVDLREGSAASLRRQVDVELCVKCHSPFPSVMQPEWQNLDCTTCHADWQDRMVGVTYINMDAITAQDCLKCHGGHPWYQERR
ncbi:MAG: cytochrome c3 family protein [Anaerolineae bacterium]